MACEDTDKTQVYEGIWVGDACDPIPSIPAQGTTPFVPGGSWIQVAVDLAAEDVAQTRVFETLPLDSPADPAPRGAVVLKNYISQVAFSFYEQKIDVSELSSTVTIDGTTATEGVDITYKAALVVIRGIGFTYYPKVIISPAEESGQTVTEVKSSLLMLTFGTDDVPVGYKKVWYTAA